MKIILPNEEPVIDLSVQINVDRDQNSAASNKTTKHVGIVEHDRLFSHTCCVIS
jgi:hypothetical protein